MGPRTGVLERVPEAYYSDERQAIIETARAFAMKEVLPVANRLDPAQGEMPLELRDKMAELGYLGSSSRRNTAASGSGSSSTCSSPRSSRARG